MKQLSKLARLWKTAGGASEFRRAFRFDSYGRDSQLSSQPSHRHVRIAVVLVYCCVAILLAAGAQGQVTIVTARAFWAEFDQNTFNGLGNYVNAVYGVTNPNDPAQIALAQRKCQGDVFTGFANSASYAISVEIRGAAATAAQKKKVKDTYDKLAADGVMTRLSDLQLLLIKNHFQNKTGGIDYDSFQLATAMFANGELRTGAPGSREMDQFHQWFVWEEFAIQAIQRNIDKDKWLKILPILQTGLEIYPQVYPARDQKLGVPVELYDSAAARFDNTKQLSDQQKQALWKQISALSYGDLVKRRQSRLQKAAQLAADGPGARLQNALAASAPANDLEFIQISVSPFGTSYFVQVVVMVSGPAGPVTDGVVGLLVADGGAAVNGDQFYMDTLLNNDYDGTYSASFVVPSLGGTGVMFAALEEGSGAGNALGVNSLIRNAGGPTQ
jgi:hypothetical protein